MSKDTGTKIKYTPQELLQLKEKGVTTEENKELFQAFNDSIAATPLPLTGQISLQDENLQDIIGDESL